MVEYSPFISKVLDAVGDGIQSIDGGLLRGFAWIGFFLCLALIFLFLGYLLLTMQFWMFGILIGILGIIELANWLGN